jgi:hypothetical protein
MDAGERTVAAAAIAAAVLASIYGVAATTATSVAGGFSTAQSDSRSRRVAFEAETTRVSAERMAALEKCHEGNRKERVRCRAAVRADEERAVLRSAYQR